MADRHKRRHFFSIGPGWLATLARIIMFMVIVDLVLYIGVSLITSNPAPSVFGAATGGVIGLLGGVAGNFISGYFERMRSAKDDAVRDERQLGKIKDILIQNRPANPFFTGVPAIPDHPILGRDTLIEQLVAELVAGQTKALSSEGKAGAGKTTLAVVIAYDKRILAHFSDGVLWASLGPQPDVISALGGWAEALGLDPARYRDAPALSRATANAIGQRRLLLVIDDAWPAQGGDANTGFANWFHCGGPNCAHLLTTRDSAVARDFAGTAHCHHIPELDPDPAYQLLQALAPEACAADEVRSRQLAREVGGLPLAIELVGGYLRPPQRSEYPEVSRQALDQLSDPRRRLQLACERLGDSTRRAQRLSDILNLSVDALPNDARHAFFALGTFAPKPETFTRAAAEAVCQAGATTLALLISRNLLERSGEDLALHQVLSDFARTTPDPAAIASHRDYYLEWVNADQQDHRRIAAVYSQVKQAWANTPDGPAVLSLVDAVRIYHQRRGLWQDRLSWTERALAVAKQAGQKKEAGTLLNNIGAVYNALGQRERALDYYNQALPILREVGDRAGEGTTLNNIGMVYYALGQREQALEYCNQALPIRREVGDRAGEGTTLNNIGMVYDNLGQRERALEFYNQALPIRREVGDRAGEGTTLNNIGSVYYALGQRERALEYYNQALPIWRKVGDRAGEGTTLNNIGSVYYALGQRDKALEYYNQALPIRREVGDRAGEEVTLYNIGILLHAMGQLAPAVDHMRQAVVLARDIQDPDYADMQATLARYEDELAAQATHPPPFPHP